ncbi:hypothetical protein F5544_09140 [Nocardia arthritidis]|uniref:PE-PGRS family protein n=2 Tax=Nocardia arthritidis TaxID=228602 RepID=A0A6G9Y927_9NOCA|nr:hypothetical protein F5544_09140 [Nocardia arthritidis]
MLEVLRVIAAGGCGDDAGSAMKVSARALEARGLVTVTRRDGWSAEVTDAGRFYLEHGYHPDRPTDCRSGAAAARVRARNPKQALPEQKRQSAPAATVRVAEDRRSAAAKLVADLVGGDRFVVERPSDESVAEWRKIVDFAKRHGMVPTGHTLVKRRTDLGALEIVLVAGTHPNSGPAKSDPARRVLVPERVDELHPLLVDLPDLAAVFDISASLVPRAQRIMHTILVEAAARGYAVDWAENPSDGAEITACNLVFRVSLAEEREEREVLPDPDELNGRKVYEWQRFPLAKRVVPSGRLVLSLTEVGDPSYPYRRWWADRKRWCVEDRVSSLLEAVPRRVREVEDRRVAAEEAADRRRRDWEAAMDRARAELAEHSRVSALDRQLADWQRAQAIRAFCAACEQQTTEVEVDGWLQWCREYADRVDPALNGTATSPEIDMKPENLRPYLRNWSPYGPDKRTYW